MAGTNAAHGLQNASAMATDYLVRCRYMHVNSHSTVVVADGDGDAIMCGKQINVDLCGSKVWTTHGGPAMCND